MIARGALVSLLCALVLVAAPLRLPAAPASEATLPPLVLRLAGGEMLSLKESLGRGPVLLDFWATWCRPCLVSLPEIQKLHERYAGRGLTVIGVSIDGPRNTSRVRPFVSRLGLTYAIALDDDGSLQARFQVKAVPTALLFAPDGTLAAQHLGYRPGDEKALAAEIERLLPAAADSTVADSTVTDTTASGAR